MIETVAEHSFETLPNNATILDVGCRGFLFTDEMRRRGHTVIAVDVDDLDRKDYLQIAIMGHDGTAVVKRSGDPQATKAIYHIGGSTIGVVQAMTLESFIRVHKVEFDLIKMDIEGSEFGVIHSLTKAPAKQLSIEFHLHTGAYYPVDVDWMVDKLKSIGYKVAQHELTEAHGCGKNYWDSLFVL